MMNRRTFLQQAGAFSAGITLLPKLSSANSVSAKYGLQLYSLRDQLPQDVKGVIAKVAGAGYRQVETFGYSKANGFWGMSAADFKKLLKANGLVSPSGHYGMDSFFSSGEPADLDNAIEAATALGQEYIVIPYLGAELRKTADDLKSVISKINIAANKAEKAGLKISYHNHDFEFENIEGKMLFDLLITETNPDLVDLEMDAYWVLRAGHDPIQYLQEHPGRFKLIHVKDMDKGDPKLNTEIGTGSIDFKPIIAAAKRADVAYYYVEQENYKMDPYASIAKSNANLRMLF